MLEILTALLTNSISKLFDTSVDIVSRDVSWKRTTSNKFIDLFSSLIELEKVSKEVYYEINGIIQGNTILTKVVIRKKLERFFKAYENFIRELRSVQSTLMIYDNELLIKLTGLREKKGFTAKILIDLMLEVSPRPIVENDRATTLIIHPTKLPSLDISHNKKFPGLNSKELEQEAKKIRKQIMRKSEFKTIDLASPKEGQLIFR